MAVYRLGEHVPQIHPSAFIAPNALIVGQAEIGENASVWFGAVVRSDTERVVIGAGSNVQDGAILHADPGDPCILGQNVTVGHRAVVHGALIEDRALIGIGAVVLNKARVGKGAMVGAGAVVPPGMEIPEGMLAIGIPAKVRGPVEPTQNAERYVELSRYYLAHLAPIAPIGRYHITLRGQDALNPFSDLHLQLKRGEPEALAALRAIAEGRTRDAKPEVLQELVREGLIRPI
ncbi:gamma carbonic anhydrase family protein [Meiothermus ruber]|jgi:carbonic anhydrase/acetyltransferase-like protein (isoleucine patch superfamily)|uniref:Carbonic anhydrase/acetyltransferase isoleucine patch superfamily n=1 Tax=Meiothermus ruber (strain ATCC 35948 / DSM 1279 / VKM B-1258 / 21) TaxID=504728 RepID=D3PSD6_MEIRD|nr:gamma carbonic anhydrase family protein [Meiothermus ruber]GIW39106.1 MAG: gamma carbonic anhydrase family protein [Meiothermus sp.]ADD28369.1 Carbonic anhydrase/acetyltransferase isoleucine patch superfamily [Meiothermus ruber DSM 1279]AGK06190.1 Carbonic anhydrase/acetyltransferase isoleucine patch superfamily protein [Meiothermus ruber DSM 1279]MCL6529027.1 gamma carbonic anhydrase family protein [Meiothermus ruber]GAO75324.1 Carbonic anhydrase/acetyltransferase isoleucine patch superfam